MDGFHNGAVCSSVERYDPANPSHAPARPRQQGGKIGIFFRESREAVCCVVRPPAHGDAEGGSPGNKQPVEVLLSSLGTQGRVLPRAAHARSLATAAGIFMGTSTERASVEQLFGITFSSDARLWQENRFSPLQGGTRFHRVSQCESEDEAFNTNLNESIVAVVEYGSASYPEFFRPREDFATSDPTGGEPPSQIWHVRGYVDKFTRVAQQLKGDGSTNFALCTLLDLTEGAQGPKAKIQYIRGGLTFAVTVVPVV